MSNQDKINEMEQELQTLSAIFLTKSEYELHSNQGGAIASSMGEVAETFGRLDFGKLSYSEADRLDILLDECRVLFKQRNLPWDEYFNAAQVEEIEGIVGCEAYAQSLRNEGICEGSLSGSYEIK